MQKIKLVSFNSEFSETYEKLIFKNQHFFMIYWIFSKSRALKWGCVKKKFFWDPVHSIRIVLKCPEIVLPKCRFLKSVMIKFFQSPGNFGHFLLFHIVRNNIPHCPNHLWIPLKEKVRVTSQQWMHEHKAPCLLSILRGNN